MAMATTIHPQTSIAPRGSDLDHLRWLEWAQLQEFRGKSILDLGCGSGYLLDLAKGQGATVTVGLDLMEAPEWQGLSQLPFRFIESDLDETQWQLDPEEKFDLILAFDIVEHLSSPYRFLTKIKSLLAPNGWLFLTTPNTSSWERVYRPQRWSGATDPQHKILFNRYNLQFLLERAGFDDIQIAAPIRKLSFMGSLSNRFGGQMVCQCRYHQPNLTVS